METQAASAKPFRRSESLRLKTYLWALSYLRPYVWQLTIVILCGLLITGIELTIPKTIQYFTDTILPHQDMNRFRIVLIGLAALLLVMFAISAWRNLVLLKLQENAARDVQYDIFGKLRALGFAYFENHPVGESLALMNTEVASLQGLYRGSLPWMVNTVIFSSISIFLLLSLSAPLTMIIIPSFLLYYVVGPRWDRKASIYAKQLAEERVKFNQKTYESFAAITEIRANSAESWDVRRFDDTQIRFFKTMLLAYLYGFMRYSARRFSYFAGGFIVIIYGIYLVRHGQLTTGSFVAFLLYFYQSMFTITAIISNITQQKVLVDQAGKLFHFIHTKPEVEEAEKCTPIIAAKGEIDFINVHYHYPNGRQVLRGLDLHVAPGEKVALVGESGNGKSTMLKLLGRFYDPQQGDILLDHIPIRDITFTDLRGNLGFVFQETYLFGSSVRENILFGKPDATEEEVVEAAKAAYAHDFIMQLPQGYDTLLGERGIRLSGGQKQRISIARMFIKNPPIILLDEATSALDNVSEREVQSALDRLLHGRTTITVAHRLSTIMDYDKIVLMEDGQVAEWGTYSQLMQLGGRFFQLATRNQSGGEPRDEQHEISLEVHPSH